MADKNLIRKQVGDVAVYKKDPNPAPGVYRSKTAETIIPEGSSADEELSSGTEVAESSPEIYLPKRVVNFKSKDKHGNEIHHSTREPQPPTITAAVRG